MLKPVRPIRYLSKTAAPSAVKSTARVVSLAAVLALLLTASPAIQFAAAQDVWLMKGHDARRTGQSGSYGIRSVDTTRSWEYVADAAFELNVGATVTRTGVFFGSWGLLRSDSLGRDTRFWNKSDGKLYGLDLDSGSELWEPARLDTVNRCYDLPGRERTSTDLLFCGLFNNYHVTFYNGTVEGQAAVDTVRQTMYVGRGDGKLYAIDPASGVTQWRFVSYNPEDASDPDGGGELIAAPLLAPDGSVYIGTWGEGPYETNAFYAVDPAGNERWRYPSDSSLDNRVFASPALSPDAQTVYQATYFGEEASVPGVLYALDLTVDDNAPDGSRLKWSFPLEFNAKPVYATTMAVGSDGTVYVGGLSPDGPVNRPVLAAFSDVVRAIRLWSAVRSGHWASRTFWGHGTTLRYHGKRRYGVVQPKRRRVALRCRSGRRHGVVLV